jgi:hypothetical protein
MRRLLIPKVPAVVRMKEPQAPGQQNTVCTIAILGLFV